MEVLNRQTHNRYGLQQENSKLAHQLRVLWTAQEADGVKRETRLEVELTRILISYPRATTAAKEIRGRTDLVDPHA